MKTICKIFPSIGIARVGNSKSDYFIGPEAPGVEPNESFRDDTGKINRQGAKFRIYKFEVDEFGRETVQREITHDTNTKITWTVHLVNKKAAGKTFPFPQGAQRNSGYERNGLIINPGSRDIAGNSQNVGPLEGDISFVKNNITEKSVKVKLGDLETDQDGRLIVLGGHGCSRSPLGLPLLNFANNDGWYDDVSDGPVTAKVTVDNQSFDAIPAWVVVAPPAFAPEIHNITTWYDQAVSVNADAFNPGLRLYQPSFTQDIYPILKRTVYLQWVSQTARSSHGSRTKGDFLNVDKLKLLCDNNERAYQARKDVFKRLVEPNQLRPHREKNMPRLKQGVDPANPTTRIPASLTSYQYFLMKKWKDGNFHSDWEGSEPVSSIFEEIPVEKQPDALTRAALESCIGGPFYPGIETTYLMALPDTYSSPYRIDRNKPPGYLTELMALPWQADFLDCGALWWPAQRPVSVKVNGNFADYSRGIKSYSQMVQHWSKLGFIIQQNNEFVENYRLEIPNS